MLKQVPGIGTVAIWCLTDAGLASGAALPALRTDAEGLECLYRSPSVDQRRAAVCVIRVGDVAWVELTGEPDVVKASHSTQLERVFEPFSQVLHGALAQRALQRERTERGQVETRLREQLARSDGAKSYRAMGHDFNNILTSILGFAELARVRLKDDEFDEIQSCLSEVRIAGERGRDAVAAMLAFARCGADDRAINIADPVTDTVRLAAGMMPRDVQLELMPGAVPPAVSIDADDIGQICLQLCVRGREPRGHVGVVRVALATVNMADFVCSTCGERHDKGEWVRLTVTDHFSIPTHASDSGALPLPHIKEKLRSVDSLSSGGVEDLVHRHRAHLLYSGRLNVDRRVDVYLPIAHQGSVSM